MKKVTYRGKSYEFETVKERQERIDRIANVGIQALAPMMEGLNAYDLDRVMNAIRVRFYSSLKVSSDGSSATLE